MSLITSPGLFSLSPLNLKFIKRSITYGLLLTALVLVAGQTVTTTGGLSSVVYGQLPTERDPDIDVETVRLGKGSIPAGGIRILADLEPFYIIDGSIQFNAPSIARNLKVIVAESTTKSITHAVILNPTKIMDVGQGESLYHVDLDEEISGRNPWTGDSDKVDRYNNVYLMHIGEGQRPISFNDQSQATVTVVFAQ